MSLLIKNAVIATMNEELPRAAAAVVNGKYCANEGDEACAVENHNVVMVPRGYHPVVAPHGYDLYYLNVMAGPNRFWVFKNAPAHEWMLAPR